MCKEAPAAVIEFGTLRPAGLATEQGRIYQRPFGGMTTHFGKALRSEPVPPLTDRSCDVHTSTSNRSATPRPSCRILRDRPDDGDGACRGVVALDMTEGKAASLPFSYDHLATGGYGRAYFSCTSAHSCTGDGNAMVLRAGLPLQDMEFVQFHPSGIYGAGCLITGGARGEGGLSDNSKGERSWSGMPLTQRISPHGTCSRGP